jgi:hypothetical protein
VFLRILDRLEDLGVKDLPTARSFQLPPLKQTKPSPEPQFLPLVSGF